MKKLFCFIGAFLLIGILCLMACILVIYLLIEEVLFILTFKKWRLPGAISVFLMYPQGVLFELLLSCFRVLVGKPFKHP